MEYETDSGIVVHDRRFVRDSGDEPRNWDPNGNTPSTVGPDETGGFGDTHVMYPDDTVGQTGTTQVVGAPPVMPWAGWPVEWNTPQWGAASGQLALIAKVSAVYGAIDLNSSILSTMPPYRMIGDTVVEPLDWMQNPQPEVYTGWIEAMKQVVIAFYTGEAFLWCTSRYLDGTVKTWVMLDPQWVSIEQLGQIRRYMMLGVDITDDVLHIKYDSWPGQPHGVGPLAALAANIFGVEAMEKYAANLAIRGGIPWGVLTTPGNLKAGQASSMQAQFVEARMSAMGAPAVMSGGLTLTPLTINPKDMALLELRMFDESRISSLLGVPPHLQGLPSQDKQTYRNAEGIYDFHWRAYLRPKAQHIMEAISNWALGPKQRVELNRDEYVRPTLADRATAYQTLFNIVDPVTGVRAITVGEIRGAERMGSIADQNYTPAQLAAIQAQARAVPVQPQPSALNAATGNGGDNSGDGGDG